MEYDKEYWEYQSVIGKIGGFLNKFKFESHIRNTDTVMDFGCGGGYLLEQISCEKKMGYEINPHARARATEAGIEVTDRWNDIKDKSVDVVISNHALEHVIEPMNSLKELHKKLKKDGKIVLVLPCEQFNQDGFFYNPEDKNQHVYSWCPQSLGNLVKAAGFSVNKCEPLHHTWTPTWQSEYKNPNYHRKCFLHSKETGVFQIKLVATKE